MIAAIQLQHYRSYGSQAFHFGDGVNIIVGPNASGKTNLLEAVLILAHGNSYRAKDAELVQFGNDWARLDGDTDTGHRTVKIIVRPKPLKTFAIDDQMFVRLHHTRQLPTVLFEPNHLLLLNGSPDMRRTFLDDLIEQIDPTFTSVRKHYRRVLAQRNALLKKNPPGLREQLFVWNVRLSELGGQIAKQRTQLIDRFNVSIATLYGNIAQRNHSIALQYASKFAAGHYETQLLHKLETNIEIDIARGYTVYGPHRDDMIAYIDERPVQEAASRGEVRTLVLALKLLELQLLEDARGIRPLLLLDDVFSELDGYRRQALTAFVATHQTFITTTDADVVAQHFAASTIISTQSE